MPSPENNKFRLYAVTDRHALPGGEGSLLDYIRRASAAGIEMIQIREKDMVARDLLALVRRAVETASEYRTAILVNDRVDIALAAGADGVHLGNHSAPPAAVREIVPPGFLIGVSTHTPDEVRAAVDGGADFITFGPVFFTASKAKYGPPVGLEALAAACGEASIPVYPIGGIDSGSYPELLGQPVAGLAAISLFQMAADIKLLVLQIRKTLGG
ncbi:MAG TPA: thiamine phosphate synthase [Acidobacteriota bacterium]|nr:thiamine phosphate synthase [Acidobacteriota bacterium]